MRPHRHQHLKTAAPTAPQRSTRTSIGQVPEHRAPCRHVLSPARTAPQNCTCASTPKCMPPSSQPSILQNNPTSSLEVRTPATQHSSCTTTPNCVKLAKQHQHPDLHLAPGRQSRKTAPPPTPETACPLAPGHHSRKTGKHSRKTAPPPTPQTECL